jgi:hypothetical protein
MALRAGNTAIPTRCRIMRVINSSSKGFVISVFYYMFYQDCLQTNTKTTLKHRRRKKLKLIRTPRYRSFSVFDYL